MDDVKTNRPIIVEDAHLIWLDAIREGGSINMFGARPYLADMFGLSRQDSQTVLTYWMTSFGNEDR